MCECILFFYEREAKHHAYDKQETTGRIRIRCFCTIIYNVSEKISLTLFMKHESTHLRVANGQRETTSVIVVMDSEKSGDKFIFVFFLFQVC